METARRVVIRRKMKLIEPERMDEFPFLSLLNGASVGCVAIKHVCWKRLRTFVVTAGPIPALDFAPGV